MGNVNGAVGVSPVTFARVALNSSSDMPRAPAIAEDTRRDGVPMPSSARRMVFNATPGTLRSPHLGHFVRIFNAHRVHARGDVRQPLRWSQCLEISAALFLLRQHIARIFR